MRKLAAVLELAAVLAWTVIAYRQGRIDERIETNRKMSEFIHEIRVRLAK